MFGKVPKSLEGTASYDNALSISVSLDALQSVILTITRHDHPYFASKLSWQRLLLAQDQRVNYMTELQMVHKA